MAVVTRLLLRSYFVMGWLLILVASRVESAGYPGEFVQNTGGVLRREVYPGNRLRRQEL